MREVEIRSVMLDGVKMMNGVPIIENGEVVKEKIEYLTNRMLDEICWNDPRWSADEAGDATFGRCAERFADAVKGDKLLVEDRDHERISAKLKEWGPRDEQGKLQSGNAFTRRVRLLINAFVFAPLVKEEATKALTNGTDKETPALPAPAS